MNKLITHLFEAIIYFLLCWIGIEASQAQRHQQAITGKECAKPLLLKNRALADSIQSYLNYVGDYEIPVIAVLTTGDTTHYYVTAFLATYTIKRNPPSALVTVNNREVLLYLGRGSIVRTAPTCYSFVMKKYSRLLAIDKLNRKEGRSPSSENNGFTYDPIKGDIFITKDGRVSTQHARKIPFIRYD